MRLACGRIPRRFPESRHSAPMADDFGDPNPYPEREDDPDPDPEREDDSDIDLERILARWGLGDPIRSTAPGNSDRDVGSKKQGTSGSEEGSAAREVVESERQTLGVGTAESATQREPFRVRRPVAAADRHTEPSRRPASESATASRRSASARGQGRGRDDRETTGHPRSRRKSFRVRQVFVGLLGIAAAVMVASAVAAARAESQALPAHVVDTGKPIGIQGELGAASMSECGSMPTESSGATAPSRLSAPGSSRPAAIASGSAVLRHDAYWLGVMRVLDDKRALTFAAGGVGEIASFDVEGGPAARLDTGLLCQLRSERVRPRGLHTVLVGVHVLSQTTTRVVLNVTDTRSAYDLVRDAPTTPVPSASALLVDRGNTASTAVVIAHQPARGQIRWLVELSWNGTEWVIRDTAQVT